MKGKFSKSNIKKIKKQVKEVDKVKDNKTNSEGFFPVKKKEEKPLIPVFDPNGKFWIWNMIVYALCWSF